jgi:predicted ribosome quality control (RQC) complex YloA/Tae2 family protein
MKELLYNESRILIGENAKENWEMIDMSSDEIWLHLESFPSCHVIIKEESPSLETIKYAACECKKNTKYKRLRDVKVCYTKSSNLELGSEVGSVKYKSKRQVNRLTV